VARRRKRGSGSISRRPDGLYVGQISLGHAPDGSRDRRSFSSKTRGDVEFWMRETLRGHQRGEDVDSRLTVAAYLDEWLEHVGPTVRPSTATNYRIHVEKWIDPVIGSENMLRLAPADVRRIPAAITKAGRAPRTAQAVLVTLRMALNQAVRDGRLERNVAEGVKAPRIPMRKVEGMTPDQARAVLAAFEEHWLGPLVTVAIGTGMRLGELLGLRWTDVDRRRIRVSGSLRPTTGARGERYVLQRSEPKTARSIRTLEPAPFVFEAIEAQRRSQRVITEYVFANRAQDRPQGGGRRGEEGGPLDPRNVTRAFQHQLAVAGLPRMRFHDLRHAYATLSLAAGVPLRVVQEALGHTSIAVTAAVYAHVLPELQREAGERLSETLFGR
jgi:integrase